MSDSETYHVEPARLGAYLEGVLSDPHRAALEDHLADCRACREELVATASLVRSASADRDLRSLFPALTPPVEPREPSARRRRRRRWRWLGAAATAAVATFLIFVPADTPESSSPAEPLRSAPGSGDGLASLTPRPADASVTGEGLQLTLAWDPVPGEVTYRLTVTGEDGATLRTAETTETAVTLDPIEGVGSGDGLFWYVDATLTNGETATTGVRRLVVP